MTANACILHCDQDSISRELKCFTEAKWTTTLRSSEQWISLDGEERVIAEQILALESRPVTSCVHLHCYIKFTNKRRIAQTERRVEKGKATGVVSPRKRTQRQNHSRASTTRSEHILPPLCILCRKNKQTKSAGKWVPERLIQVS